MYWMKLNMNGSNDKCLRFQRAYGRADQDFKCTLSELLLYWKSKNEWLYSPFPLLHLFVFDTLVSFTRWNGDKKRTHICYSLKYQFTVCSNVQRLCRLFTSFPMTSVHGILISILSLLFFHNSNVNIYTCLYCIAHSCNCSILLLFFFRSFVSRLTAL